jgi:hypothetical protein
MLDNSATVLFAQPSERLVVVEDRRRGSRRVRRLDEVSDDDNLQRKQDTEFKRHGIRLVTQHDVLTICRHYLRCGYNEKVSYDSYQKVIRCSN